MSEVPRAVEDIVRQRERTQQALDRAVAPFPPEPEPDPASGAEAFTRRMAEQREREERHEALVRQAMFENPDPPLDEPDPLRTLAGTQQRERVWRRRTGRARLGL